MPRLRRIPEAEWHWYGRQLHLLVAFNCHFHLSTLVGDVVVSTSGDYRNKRSRALQTIKSEYEYETMVFPRSGDCDCGCGQPEGDIRNVIDFRGYRTIAAANEGHRELCESWAKRGGKYARPA